MGLQDRVFGGSRRKGPPHEVLGSLPMFQKKNKHLRKDLYRKKMTQMCPLKQHQNTKTLKTLKKLGYCGNFKIF